MDAIVAQAAAALALSGDDELLRRYVEAWASIPGTAATFLAAILQQGVATERALVPLWVSLGAPIVDSESWDTPMMWDQGGGVLIRTLICQPRWLTFALDEWPPAASVPFTDLATRWVRRFAETPNALTAISGYASLPGKGLDTALGLGLEAVVAAQRGHEEIWGTDEAVTWLSAITVSDSDRLRYRAIVD